MQCCARPSIRTYANILTHRHTIRARPVYILNPLFGRNMPQTNAQTHVFLHPDSHFSSTILLNNKFRLLIYIYTLTNFYIICKTDWTNWYSGFWLCVEYIIFELIVFNARWLAHCRLLQNECICVVCIQHGARTCNVECLHDYWKMYVGFCIFILFIVHSISCV